jgi:hypothetical protein
MSIKLLSAIKRHLPVELTQVASAFALDLLIESSLERTTVTTAAARIVTELEDAFVGLQLRHLISDVILEVVAEPALDDRCEANWTGLEELYRRRPVRTELISHDFLLSNN